MPLFISSELRAVLYCECKRLFDATSKIGSLPVVMWIVRNVVSLQEEVTSLTGLKSNRIRASYMRLYGRDVFLGPGKVD